MGGNEFYEQAMAEGRADVESAAADDFAAYLRQPCDEPGCNSTATHNQAGRKVCNKHTDWDAPAFARDD